MKITLMFVGGLAFIVFAGSPQPEQHRRQTKAATWAQEEEDTSVSEEIAQHV